MKLLQPLTFASVVLLLSPSVWAQLPETRLDEVYPCGGQAGTELEVTIAGNDLDNVDQLLFSHPNIKAVRKMQDAGPFDEGPMPVDNTFTVNIGGNVPPGRYEVRCQGLYGLSNPRGFFVDNLPETPETEPNSADDPLAEITVPGILTGKFNSAADDDWYQFTAQPGQKMLISGYARRADSRSDLLLSLIAPDGRIVAENRQGFAGDPLIVYQFPAAGPWKLRVRDALHRGGDGFTYRIAITGRPHIDYVFPPAGTAGSNDEYTVYGRNLPGGQPANFSLDGQPLEQVRVRIAIPGNIADQLLFTGRVDPHQAGMDGIQYVMASPAGPSNPALITVSENTPVGEQGDNNLPAAAQPLTLPCEVHGQFYPARDLDWYTFAATAGQKLHLNLISHRLGCNTDATLLVQKVTKTDDNEEQVQQITYLDEVTTNIRNRAFDHRTTDPVYVLDVTEDAVYRVMVRDNTSGVRNDPRLVYRLRIREAKPDFRLAASPIESPGSLLLRKGAHEAIRVNAFRDDGFDGEIKLTLAGLPGGVTASEAMIGAGSDYTVVVLSAAANAPGAASAVTISGTASVNGQNVTRKARVGRTLEPFTLQQPNANVGSVSARLTDTLQISVSNEEHTLVAVTAGEGKLYETSRGGIVKIPWTVTRAADVGGTITAIPVGLPPNLNAPQVAMGANEKGEMELRIQATTPPGNYTWCLYSQVQGGQYSRNPAATDLAVKRQERIAEILKKATEATAQAQRDQQASVTQVNQRTTALNTANTAKTQADQKLAQTEQALRTAATTLDGAKKVLAAAPDDADAAKKVKQEETALTQATKDRTEAEAAAKKATVALTDANKAKTDAEALRVRADEDLTKAREFQQQAQQEKTRADQDLARKRQSSNRRAFNFRTASVPVMIKIHEFPITHQGPPAATVKQGEAVDLTFNITRLYGFDQNVSLQGQVPGGVGGLSIPNVNIAQGQGKGALKITAAANATAGDHEINIRLQMNFNGQNLILNHPLKLTVVAVEATQ